MANKSNISQYLETLISEKGRDIDANLGIEGNVTYATLLTLLIVLLVMNIKPKSKKIW
jgi:hypothetical protein